MTDYIKREDAVRRIAVLMAAEAESDGCEDQPMDTYIEYASEDLADIPSADVAPVRHGRWMPLTDCSNEGIYCSACHKKVYRAEYSNTMKMHSPYCPNCGAKMDMEEDNE